MSAQADPRRSSPPPVRKTGGNKVTIVHQPAKSAAAPEKTLPAAQPHPHAVPPAAGATAPKEAPTSLARSTLFDALMKDVGQPGSVLQHPHGQSFTVRADLGEGAVHTRRTLMVPLPKGGSVPHTADIALELESGDAVYVDILDSNARLQDLKAHAFDAMLLKQNARGGHFAVLVLVRLPHPLHSQDLVEAIAHGYDYVFGVDETNVALANKFAACKSEILKRIKPSDA